MLPCLNKKLLGVDCPGCGLQRSVALLFHGEFIAAFQMYPAIYTLIPLFGILIFKNFVKIKYASILTIILSISTVVLILTNYILKFI
ncbi:DUF2752 domain-containing protein [Spongiimicrobium salis]|uniref:DUF2752 domain-containing protein n=1 Tax=Spongiimicrobium salis TaxID=1667022 RepID=UPI00374C9CED